MAVRLFLSFSVIFLRAVRNGCALFPFRILRSRYLLTSLYNDIAIHLSKQAPRGSALLLPERCRFLPPQKCGIAADREVEQEEITAQGIYLMWDVTGA